MLHHCLQWYAGNFSRLSARRVPKQIVSRYSNATSAKPSSPKRPQSFFSDFLTRWQFFFTKGFPVALALHIFWSYAYSIQDCYGVSMMPTFASAGEWIILDKYYRRGRNVQVGDVVSFKSPIMEGEANIKRVIGMAGDFVLMNTPGRSDAMIQVPEGHCWVVGDNLPYSRDSRMYGPLPLALIVGKVTTFKLYWWEWTSRPRWTRIKHGLQPAADEDEVN